MGELPELNEEQGVRLEVLMELFFNQFWTFSEYINDTDGKVPTEKYADFVLFALKKRLDELYSDLAWKPKMDE